MVVYKKAPGPGNDDRRSVEGEPERSIGVVRESRMGQTIAIELYRSRRRTLHPELRWAKLKQEMANAERKTGNGGMGNMGHGSGETRTSDAERKSAWGEMRMGNGAKGRCPCELGKEWAAGTGSGKFEKAVRKGREAEGETGDGQMVGRR